MINHAVQVVWPRIEQPEEKNDQIGNECDRHQPERERVAGNDQRTADDHQQKLLPRDQCCQGQECPDGECSGIAHKHLGGVTVEPQKSEHRSHQGADHAPGAGVVRPEWQADRLLSAGVLAAR